MKIKLKNYKVDYTREFNRIEAFHFSPLQPGKRPPGNESRIGVVGDKMYTRLIMIPEDGEKAIVIYYTESVNITIKPEVEQKGVEV